MKNFLNLFIFFSVFPSVKLFGISITLYFFLIFIFSVKNLNLQITKSKIFIYFLIIILFSSLLSFTHNEVSHPGILYILKITSQYFYWIVVALFFKSYFSILDHKLISKYFFIAVICLLFSFFIFNFKFEIGFLSINTQFTRNNFVFTLLASFPLCYYYTINNLRLKKISSLIPIIFFLLMFISEGRSGILIFIIQFLFITIIMNPKIKRLYKLIIGLLIVASFSGNILENQIQSFSYFVEQYNPRIGQFIRGEGESNIDYDKSLMVRLIMIDKTFEIFEKYPLLGIGPNMFVYYNAKLVNRRQEYERLNYRSNEYLNKRSSHGVYYQALAEFGLIGIFLLIIIILTPIFFFLKKLFVNKTNTGDLFFISFIGVSLHFFTVSALTGTIGWVIIGIAWSIYIDNKTLLNYGS